VRTPSLLRRLFPGFLLILLVGACGGDGPATPQPVAPTITISGVEPGQRYSEPVTIQITVDRGSYEATLNGAPFLSGRTVSAPGDYRLEVTARSGTAIATRTVEFSLQATSVLIIRMLDLGPEGLGGGGDAILLTDSSGLGMRHAVIDAGPRGVAGVVDANFVAQRLQQLGVDTLEFLQLTHAHADHFGAMGPILERIHVRRFIYNGQIRSLVSYQAVLSLAQMRADSVIVPQAVREYRWGSGEQSTRFAIIPPLASYLQFDDPSHPQYHARLNEGSLGTALTRGSFRMFFTGDGEYEANHRWRTQFAGHTTNLEVLKVGHHGANNAIFDVGTTGPSSWLTQTAPRVSIVSSNGISHPRVRALNRLQQQPNNRTYCTHVHGTIMIRVALTGDYNVAVERNANADCVPGSAADT
jgi:beta-lactamase superfamily II metal-dependent hydrolase